MPLKKSTPILILFFLFLFFKSLFWALLVPSLEFPDEQAHFSMTQFVAETKRLPQGQEPDLSSELKETETYLGTLRDKQGNNRFTYHPNYKIDYTNTLIGKYELAISTLNNPQQRTTFVAREAARYPFLYYLYTSLFYYLAYPFNLFSRLFTIRFSSVILATVIAYITYLLGKEVFSNQAQALLLTFLVSLQPMFSFISSGINSDNLHILWFTLLIYLCVRLIKQGWTNRLVVQIGLTIALDFLTKPQAYIALPVLLIAATINLIRQKKVIDTLKNLALVLLIILILAGWQEIPQLATSLQSNKALYTSDINYQISSTSSFIDFTKFSLNKLYAQNSVWYWGVFKWLGVVLPKVFWQLANRLILISGFGLLIYLIKVIKKQKTLIKSTIAIFSILTSFIYVAAIFFYDWQFTNTTGYSLGVQARYYFPTITAHLILLMLGFFSLAWNQQSRGVLKTILVLFFTSLQLAGIYTINTSYYHPTSVNTLITQASQYKPAPAKGNWWYLWVSLYAVSVLGLTVLVIKPPKIGHET